MPRRSVLSKIDPAIVALTVLGVALACYHLGSKSLWLDEAVSAEHARLGLGGLLKVISGPDPNQGLYYVLLHFWVGVFGSSEVAVRSMTVLLAAPAVPLIALLGERLFGRTAGLAAGLLLALNPFFLQYEQTARSYAIVVMLSILSCLLFLDALERPSAGRIGGYVLVSALAVYTHYFAVFVLLVQLLALIALKRREAPAREWPLAAAAIVVLCAPEAVFALKAGSGNVSWIPKPTIHDLLHFPLGVAGGAVLGGLLVLLAMYGFLRMRAAGRTWQAWFLAAWLLLPVLLDFAVSVLGHPLFLDYYLIVVLPAFLLLGAIGLVELPRPAAGAIALAALIVLSALGIRSQYRRPGQEDYRAATRLILARERPGDGLLAYPSGLLKGPTSGIDYYEARAGRPGPALVGFGLNHGLGARPPRIWLVLRNTDVPPHEQLRVERRLSAEYAEAGPPLDFRNVSVLLYRRRSG